MHLNAFRRRLQQRRNELHARSSHIDSDLRYEAVPTEGGFVDQSSLHANDAVLKAIRASAEIELQQIDHALRRLDDGRYERCEKCDGPIERERLQAVPYATTCIGCTG